MAKVLARGRGINSMLQKCYDNGWSEDNSTLVVKDKNDLNSPWTLYAK